MTEPLKKCFQCKQDFPVAEFYDAEKDHLRPRCKACRAENQAKKNK